MSKSKFFTASSSDDSSEDDSPQVRRVVAKNRFAIDSSSDSESGSGSGSGSDSDSNSSSSGSSYETSSESDSSLSSAASADGAESSGDEAAKRGKRMLRWLKDSDDERETKTKVAKPKAAIIKPKVEATPVVPVPAGPALTLNPEEARERISEVLRSRGRKGVDRLQQLQRLGETAQAMAGVGVSQWTISDRLSLESAEISVRLDKSPLSQPEWRELVVSVTQLLATAVGNGAAGIFSPEDQDDQQERRRKLALALATFAELLDEDLFKTLQAVVNVADTPEVYVARLRDVPLAMKLLTAVLEFLKNEPNTGLLQAKLSLKLLEHLHYQSNASMNALIKNHSSSLPKGTSPTTTTTTDGGGGGVGGGIDSIVRSLAITAAQQGGLKEKTLALLLLSFYLATRATTTQDFELVKRLVHCDMGEYLSTAEVATQVAYNRMLGQVGLAAFRLGKIEEAHYFLGELCGGNKTRELLAQTGSRGEKTPDQERAERRRMLPYHMHMDAEMIDSVYFLCAMMLEMPLVVGKSGKVASRSFRKFLEHYERNVATGPPENFRETIAVAGRALASGEVDKATELVMTMDFWSRVGVEETAVKDRIVKELKVSGLKAFLVGNLAIQDSYRLPQLADLFKIDQTAVKTEITAAILAGDVEGALIDETQNCVVAKTVKTARFAAIAVELKDKLENNLV